MVSRPIPVLIVSAISSHVTAPAELTTSTPPWPPTISSNPILYTPPVTGSIHIEGDGGFSSNTTVPIANRCIYSWLCIDDVFGSFQLWSEFEGSGSVVWNIVNLLTTNDTSALFKIFHNNICATIMGSMGPVNIMDNVGDRNLYGMDAMFIPYRRGTVMVWCGNR